MSHDAFCPQSEPDETSPCHCDGIINVRADSDHRHEDIRSEIIALMERLYAVFTPEQAAIWLDSANSFLNGTSPRAALTAGRVSDVRSAIEGFAAGVYL